MTPINEIYFAFLRSYHFGMWDLRRRFKMSILGPIWSCVSAIIISAIIFTVLSGLSLSKSGYSDLVVGLYIWSFASGFLTEATSVFVSASGLIRNTRLPLSEIYSRFFLSQVVQKSVTSLVMAAFLILYCQDLKSALALLIFTIVFASPLYLIGFFLAAVGAKYRDLPSFLSIILQVTFYATPILWSTSMIGLDPVWNHFNIFFHFINWVREPNMWNAFWPNIIALPLYMFGYWAFQKRIRGSVVHWV